MLIYGNSKITTLRTRKMNIVFLVFVSLLVASVLGQHHEDKRCRCVCPSPSAVINGTRSSDLRLFIANVPPNKCNCDGVILPRVGDLIRSHELEYCPRCECKYESRNSSVIMFVVVLLVWVVAVLVVYMGFLKCLDPLLNKRRHLKVYHEPGSEEARNLLVTGEAED